MKLLLIILLLPITLVAGAMIAFTVPIVFLSLAEKSNVRDAFARGEGYSSERLPEGRTIVWVLVSNVPKNESIRLATVRDGEYNLKHNGSPSDIAAWYPASDFMKKIFEKEMSKQSWEAGG